MNVNDKERKVEIIFDNAHTDERHNDWAKSVKERAGHLGNFDIVPYWGFDDLFHKAGTKLKNCFYVRADVKREGKGKNRKEYFLYNYVLNSPPSTRTSSSKQFAMARYISTSMHVPTTTTARSFASATATSRRYTSTPRL